MPELFGKNVKPQTLWIGGGATLVFGIAYYRYSKAQKANQAAAAAAVAPGTGAGSSDQIDPATGFAYGSPEDAAALSAQAGYQNPLAPGYGYGGANNYPAGTIPGTAGGFTNNAQWAQAAEQFLTGEGDNSNAVGNALGKYITGGVITDDTSQSYVNQAIAFEGYPPVAGPGGFPPSIQTGPAPHSGGGGGGTPAQKVTVPKVVGMTSGDAFMALRDTALNPEPGGIKASRIVISTNPPAGKLVPKHTTVTVKVK